MKKFSLYILCFFIGSLSLSWLAFAEECQKTCKIEDGPAPALEQYLNNLNKVINRTLRNAGSGERDDSSARKAQWEILTQMSKIIDFSGYFSSFDYYVAIPITNEVPQQVKRDHNRLDRETERLSRLLKRAIRSWYGDVYVEDACQDVEWCDLEWTVRGILTVLLKNNKKIVDYYRLSIVDEKWQSDADFILVPDNFDGEMEQYYNKDTLSDCSLCEWGFFEKITESIDKIWSLNSSGTEWIRKWKEAWGLISGAVGQSTYTKEEDRVLREYLWKQGINGSASDTVTDNLQRYNSGGLSSSNPFFNSFNYTFSKTEEDIGAFNQALENHLDTSQEEIPIVVLREQTDKAKTTGNIQSEIAAMFEDMIPFSAVQDTGSEKAQAKLIRMHYSLVRSINILDKTVKVSQEVCDSQGQWQGKCDYR